MQTGSRKLQRNPRRERVNSPNLHPRPRQIMMMWLLVSAAGRHILRMRLKTGLVVMSVSLGGTIGVLDFSPCSQKKTNGSVKTAFQSKED